MQVQHNNIVNKYHQNQMMHSFNGHHYNYSNNNGGGLAASSSTSNLEKHFSSSVNNDAIDNRWMQFLSDDALDLTTTPYPNLPSKVYQNVTF